MSASESSSRSEKDAHSGTSTTGHDWDGIKELNTPMPRWWLYTFYACIVWAFGYWLIYPAWPLLWGYTHGFSGWQSRSAAVSDVADLHALRTPMNEKLAKASLSEIEKTPELLAFARAEGGAAFAINCAPCHGAGGQGSPGYPNLNADRWIWGGKLDQIATTITHGARWSDDPDTHPTMMPAFGHDGILKPAEISIVADYVRTLSGNAAEPGANLTAGKKIFADNCAACHGDDAKGNIELGAPNLTTQVWLYGSTKADIVHRVMVGGGGVMPAWGQKLDAPTIKALTVFVHSLGGGQ
jgi:cytochrome c oxidase cbb3-type subunit 3